MLPELLQTQKNPAHSLTACIDSPIQFVGSVIYLLQTKASLDDLISLMQHYFILLCFDLDEIEETYQLLDEFSAVFEGRYLFMHVNMRADNRNIVSSLLNNDICNELAEIRKLYNRYKHQHQFRNRFIVSRTNFLKKLRCC